MDTAINLSHQGDTVEKFQPNLLSRVSKGQLIWLTLVLLFLQALKRKLIKVFKLQLWSYEADARDLPAFDLIRASINLAVAGVLISIATGMKLPLSTTYVTFMVAMGTPRRSRLGT